MSAGKVAALAVLRTALESSEAHCGLDSLAIVTLRQDQCREVLAAVAKLTERFGDIFNALADLGEQVRPDNWDDQEFEEDGSADCWRRADDGLANAVEFLP